MSLFFFEVANSCAVENGVKTEKRKEVLGSFFVVVVVVVDYIMFLFKFYFVKKHVHLYLIIIISYKYFGLLFYIFFDR